MLWRWLKGWRDRRGPGNRPAAAVYVSPRSVATARGHAEGSRIVLDLRADALAQPDEAAAALRAQSRQLDVAGAPCNLVLSPELYSLTLIERPQVPDDELREAVRWRLQDTLDCPPDQAAVDVFPLPESASRERAMVFVAAIRRDALARIVDWTQQAGVAIDSVDIAELALRNLSYELYPEADCPVALLRLTAASGIINVARGEELFLSRRISGIPAELSETAWRDFDDRLLLQVQRSIDYYESAMGQPPCKALIVATTEGWQDKVCGYLGEMLPLPVRSLKDEVGTLFDLTLHNPEAEPVDWTSPTPDQCAALTAAMPAMGGLLRLTGLGAAAPQSAVPSSVVPSRSAA